MNGVHDLGGTDGLGPVEIPDSEPVFRADWDPDGHLIEVGQTTDRIGHHPPARRGRGLVGCDSMGR